jgi:hypothetical protein
MASRLAVVLTAIVLTDCAAKIVGLRPTAVSQPPFVSGSLCRALRAKEVSVR